MMVGKQKPVHKWQLKQKETRYVAKMSSHDSSDTL